MRRGDTSGRQLQTAIAGGLLLLAAGLPSTGCGGESGGRPQSPPDAAPPLPETFPGRLPNAASFLMDGADVRIMNGLSAELDESAFREQVQWCVDNRDDTIALYLTNRGDGVPRVTSFYVDDAYRGAIDPDRVDAMRARIEHCRAQNLRIHLWVWADDSGFGDVDDETHQRHLANCVALFDDLADTWCVGLELDEVFRKKARVVRLAKALKRLTTRPVGVHFTNLAQWKWAVDAEADILFGQYGFDHDAERIRRDTEEVLRRLDGRVAFWAWEYHLSSRSAEAKALGDAAFAVPGCMGTGNGRTKETR